MLRRRYQHIVGRRQRSGFPRRQGRSPQSNSEVWAAVVGSAADASADVGGFAESLLWLWRRVTSCGAALAPLP